VAREEEALRALGAAQRAYQQELAHKARLLQQLEDSLIRRESLGIEPVGPVAFQLEQDFIVGTKQRLIKADQAILRASKAVEKALRAYLAARRQTKMMDTLREKDFVEWRKAAAKREQLEMDDLSIMRARFREESAL
jgi:flagellar export protein FliJ